MAAFTRSDELRGAEFVDADLRGARFVGADLSGVVMSGVDVSGADIDDPGLFDGESSLRVNGVDVVPLVEAELNTVDVSVGGEWSLAQTLRHLVLATDMWLRGAVLEIEQPFHPIGQTDASLEADGRDMSIFTTVAPSYAEVLEVWAGRVAMVRDFLATVTSDELAATRRNPHDPECQETVLSTAVSRSF